MYQALYRKYRPSDFDNVVGQDIIVKTLKNSINNNKISHAYLFSGPRGTGKTSIAKIFAKTVNCNQLENTTPCNECVSCTLIDNNQNVDIIEIDAASNNGVDEIRELKSKVNLVPSVSKYKVYIIDEVHMLTSGAFNALLKTLEEPPKHVIFILATTEPQKIPETILSRCQRYDFKRISIDNIVKRLKFICSKEKISITEEALIEIARVSEGGMRDSIGMLDQVISYKENNIVLNDIHDINGTLTLDDLCEFIKSIIDKDPERCFDLLDEYISRGKNLNKIISETIQFLRNVLIYNSMPNYLKQKGIDVSYYSLFNNYNINIYDLILNLNNILNESKYSSNLRIMFEIEILKNISQEIKIKSRHVKTEKESQEDNNNTIKNKDNIVEEKQDPDKISQEIINNIKTIRIDNTLSKFDKKLMILLKNNINNSKELVLNDKFGKYLSLILDGNIKAASDEYIIFVYENENDSNIFNENIVNIEKLINNIVKKYYKVISVSKKEWEIIKDNFNNKKIKYIYKPELIDIYKHSCDNDLVDNTISMEKMFDSIIEYTEEEII